MSGRIAGRRPGGLTRYVSCSGIEALDSALVADNEFTLHGLARAKPWDWAWLSGDEA